MRKTSKYLNKQFGQWTCTHVGIAATSKKYNSNYYYIFERETSDGKAQKIIRLSSTEAAKVYNGFTTVEDIAITRVKKYRKQHTKRVNYHFN